MPSSGNPVAPVVSNTTPLITLVGIGLLDLLPALYQTVQIPTAVYQEFQVGRTRFPGSPDLATLSWLTVHTVTPDPVLLASLDAGEAEAISLALVQRASLLLLDERHGRVIATHLGLQVAGSLTVLLQAKQQGLVPFIAPLLDQMVAQGRRLSPQLRARVLVQAGE